tara:strand:+ start:1294 stop:1491 length:198 start_codon:yes stop_codon:yes gene_type:complete
MNPTYTSGVVDQTDLASLNQYDFYLTLDVMGENDQLLFYWSRVQTLLGSTRRVSAPWEGIKLFLY